MKVTSAGFEPSEVIDVAVKPTGAPSGDLVVMTATPEACLLKAAFRASLASWFRLFSSIDYKISRGVSIF